MAALPDADNPLLRDWTAPFGAPPFAEIRPEHFAPAFERAFADHEAEIEEIAVLAAAPSFDNTILALERSGALLERVADVFSVLVGADSNDALLEIERVISPRLATHWSNIHMNQGLFRRVEELRRNAASLALTAEQARVLTRYHLDFRRAGAGLEETDRRRLSDMVERLAELGTQFSQNVLADEQSTVLELLPDDLAGLPAHVVASARAAAKERGRDGHLVTMSRSSVEPFLSLSSRRDLREKAWRAFVARGDHDGEHDNKPLIAETVRLRAEAARLLGYDTYARFQLDDNMAKTPDAARDLLEKVWRPAVARANADRAAMQEMIRAEGGNFDLAPWDWRYYAEKLRKVRCDLAEGEIEPYLPLERMIEAAFDTAHRLFGLSFKPRTDVPTWHPDVRVFEVTGRDGRHVGLFFGDYFGRTSKRSGAWMTSLRDQDRLAGDRLDGETRPLIVNVMNFNKGEAGAPTLLSFDDARTLFHEFGHALHGLLSDVTYPRISGTSVETDFVELPSQLYEHWLERPEVLSRFARHHATGEAMPDALIKKLVAARTFNQGFTTVEFVASALVDLDFHSLAWVEDLDPAAFEEEALERIGMPAEIAMRHRPPHFQHVFADDDYAAAYYSYMWSEVLDADAFQAFEETGDVFDPGVAERLLKYIFSAGGSRAPDEAYTAFRGRLPSEEALLRRRGLVDAA
ncbi:M3 family metallopeptidase [Xanthobacteraceae bacterium Astr-EGSB]|uniref:M3 family metallopeptidase n=1 Tax=Astrobacterium formosum TaxID=3069710 RepID=UPI0027B5592B|nr:M3 family metallopeptidase [Xanthobacteraceae bacterium Astr-EGSB]